MSESDIPLSPATERRVRRFSLRLLEHWTERLLYHLHDFSGRRLNARIAGPEGIRPDSFIRFGTRGPELVILLRSMGIRGAPNGPSFAPDPAFRTAGGVWRPSSSDQTAGAEAEGWNSSRRFRRLGSLLRVSGFSYLGLGLVVCLLVMVASLSFLGIRHLKPERFAISGEALALETRVASSGEDLGQIKRLLAKVFGLNLPVAEARPVSVDPMKVIDPEEVMIEQEMALLMKEFGAERLTVPPDFIKEVQRYVGQYQERDRSLMARALVDKHGILEEMRGILRNENLPEDLAYMALVESGFLRSSESQEGAVGFWQFTEETAREYGMEVSENVDDRLDLSKSTEAASRYIRDLILDFGTGSSVMLAMAAYNSGPDKVKRAVRKVKDPINQRNFWYLYQTRALPAETREYVPKVFAAILIGRNPEQFGFQAE